MAEIVDKVIVEGAEELGEKLFGDLFKGGEKAAKEAAEKVAEEAAAKQVAEEAAEKAAEEAAAKQVAEEAAEKVAAAEAVTVESEAGLEARIKAEEEAVEAAEKAAEVEARLGSRIAKALGKQIVAALKGVLQLVKVLAKDAGDLLLLQMAIDQTPKEYRKELASWALMLVAGGNQLALVAYMYMGLSGGSEEGKQVAQEAHQVVKDMHKKARDLNIDSPSNVPIDEDEMKQVKLQAEKDKKDLDKTNGILGDLKGMLEDRQHNKPIEENNGSPVTNTMTLAWVGSALGAAAAERATEGAAEAAEVKAGAAKEAATTAKAAAVEAAATVAAAAAAAAAEEAAAEAVMVKSKAGIEATVKAETEAVEVAKKAARLGARLGAVEGEKIEAELQGALHLLDRLTSNALLKMGKEELPTVYRKVLAGWGMTVAAEGIKLVLVAFNYMGLSGGSNHAKMVAKNAQENVTRLHKKALKLIEEESPSNKVPIINKETHQHLMEKIKHHVDSEKQQLGKMTEMLDQIDDSMKKYMKDHPLVLLKRPTQAA